MTALAIADLTDMSTFTPSGGFDMTEIPISGPRVVLEWVARAWLTQRRWLFWQLNRGVDIARLENADLSDRQQDDLRATLEDEAQRTEFVRSAKARVIVGDTITTIEGQITLTDGKTYPLAVTIDKADEAITRFGS